MKLKYEYENVEIDDSIMAIPLGEMQGDSNLVIRLNDSAAFIFDLLKEEISENEIIEKILAEFKGDPDEIKEFVEEFIAQLREKDIISE